MASTECRMKPPPGQATYKVHEQVRHSGTGTFTGLVPGRADYLGLPRVSLPRRGILLINGMVIDPTLPVHF